MNDEESPSGDQSRQINRRHWEEVCAHHPDCGYYDLERFRRTRCSLSSVEMSEVGNVDGLRGVHLQCGIGLETMSLSGLGADMTGVDFADSAVTVARRLAQECGFATRFEQLDVFEAGGKWPAHFDFVYTSHGVLRWLPSLRKWSESVAALLKPGGFFYVFEIHPLLYRLQAVDHESMVLEGDYFEIGPKVKRRRETHVGALPSLENDLLVHFDWRTSDILNALLEVGLHLEFYNEHIGTSYSRKGMISELRDNLWHIKGPTVPMPLAFSLRARKPARRL